MLSSSIATFPKSAALDALADGVMATDAGSASRGRTIVYVNDAACEITGYSREELLGRSPSILQGPATDTGVLERLRAELAAGRSFTGQAINYRKDGTAFLMEWSVSPLFGDDGRPEFFVAVQRDATVPASRLMDAERQARTDPLTGLPNRAHIDEILDAGSWLSTRVHSAVVVDVDRFKPLNDEHGHLVGDEVLRLLAQRLARSVRGGDIVARWGGEEFCVLMVGDSDDASALATRIVTAIGAHPFETAAGSLVVTASAGSATGGSGPQNALEILRAADAAMYDAKRGGGNRAARAS